MNAAPAQTDTPGGHGESFYLPQPSAATEWVP
jgi:hypothetical protein